MQPVPSWLSFTIVAIIIAAAWLALHAPWSRAMGTRSAMTQLNAARCMGLAGACAIAFAVLTAALLGGTAVTALDDWTRAAVRSLYGDGFVQACIVITSFGGTTTLVAVTATAGGVLWVRARARTAVGLAISALGSQLTVYVLKYAIGRERPMFEAFATAASPSFPSAHATGAVAVYGFVTYALARELSPRPRAETAFWGGVFVVLLAVSRVVLGVHFLSDVVAGLLVGLAWLALGVWIANTRPPMA